MAEQSQSTREKPKQEIKILAYGFNAAGFEIPTKTVTVTNSVSVEFIPFLDTTTIDSADGVIIPQGVFEKVDHNSGNVITHTALLLERQRQVNNLIKEGKWVCFLVGEIEDTVTYTWGSKEIKDTDLCKRFLNIFRVYRRTTSGLTLLETTEDEFKSHLRKYGVAKTILELSPVQHTTTRILVTSGENVVGVEFLGQIFFLPFHTIHRDSSGTETAVKIVTQAILDYRQKRIVEVPSWADEFQFQSEEELQQNISLLLEETNTLQAQLQPLREYKTILTTSGDILRDKIIRILEHFFHLKVDAIDEYREDAKIVDEQDNILAMVETKGTKKGIKREHINQVDSHRERNNLTDSTPGVLLINNEMSVVGIGKRLETTVPDEQIKHANNLNILIVRTIDLLFLMLHLENSSNRKKELIRLMSLGGGWLKADPKGYNIVVE